jgi:hypothetical protein
MIDDEVARDGAGTARHRGGDVGGGCARPARHTPLAVPASAQPATTVTRLGADLSALGAAAAVLARRAADATPGG